MCLCFACYRQHVCSHTLHSTIAHLHHFSVYQPTPCMGSLTVSCPAACRHTGEAELLGSMSLSIQCTFESVVRRRRHSYIFRNRCGRLLRYSSSGIRTTVCAINVHFEAWLWTDLFYEGCACSEMEKIFPAVPFIFMGRTPYGTLLLSCSLLCTQGLSLSMDTFAGEKRVPSSELSLFCVGKAMFGILVVAFSQSRCASTRVKYSNVLYFRRLGVSCVLYSLRCYSSWPCYNFIIMNY